MWVWVTFGGFALYDVLLLAEAVGLAGLTAYACFESSVHPAITGIAAISSFMIYVWSLRLFCSVKIFVYSFIPISAALWTAALLYGMSHSRGADGTWKLLGGIVSFALICFIKYRMFRDFGERLDTEHSARKVISAFGVLSAALMWIFALFVISAFGPSAIINTLLTRGPLTAQESFFLKNLKVGTSVQVRAIEAVCSRIDRAASSPCKLPRGSTGKVVDVHPVDRLLDVDFVGLGVFSIEMDDVELLRGG